MASRYSAEVLAVITATDWDTAPTVTTVRAALYGGMYDDTVNPSGPAVHYPGRIKSDVVLDKRIGVEFWNEDSGIDFGYLDIALEDQKDTLINFAQYVTIATVDLYRVNTTDPGQPQLELIASARSSDIGFTDEATVRVRMESVLQGGFDTPINELYYDSTYPQLEGKPYPIAWCNISDPEQLIPTTFVDAVYLLYHITDITINTFETFVYDRGVELGASGEFTPQDYGFVLNQNPDGKITSGDVELEDPVDSGVLAGLYRFIRLGMTRAGIWANANETELLLLEAAINKGEVYPQFFTQRVVSLKDYLTAMLDGTGSWYYVDELTEVHFGRLTSPDAATPVFVFTDANTTGDIKVEDDKAPGLSTRLDYGENPGAYEHDELAGAVSNDDRLLMTNKTYTSETVEPVISFYEKAAAREPIKLAMSYAGSTEVSSSWTADSTVIKADSTLATADGFATITVSAVQLAQTEVDRWWTDLYPQRRRFYTWDVPLNNSALENGLPQLGDVCSLQSDRFKLLDTAKNLVIRRVRFNFSDNLLTVQGWG